MTAIELIVDIVFISCSNYVAYYAIRRWLRERYNHEDIFFWGLSFLLLGINSIAYLLNPFLNIPGINYSVHITDTFIRVFQLYAILLNTISCDHSHKCKTCKRKIVRFSMWMILIPITFLFPIAVANLPHSMPLSSLGLQGMQMIGIKPLDLTIESIHLLIAIIACLAIPKTKEFAYMKFAFMLAAIRELLQIINISKFNYMNNSLFELEWSLAIVSILCLSILVYRIVRDKE